MPVREPLEGYPGDDYTGNDESQQPTLPTGSDGTFSFPGQTYTDADVENWLSPQTGAPTGGLYGLLQQLLEQGGKNPYESGINDTADYFRTTGNRTWQDDANAGRWAQYGGFTQQASDGFDDPYNMGWNLREMQTAEGADRFGQDPGRYDPYSNDMLNRMSGNAYRGASWDPWNMGWSQREADTARTIDAEGWDDPRYRAQREGIANNGNQVWDEEQRIYDQYGNIASGGANPYQDPMEYLAAQNGRGEGRYEPIRGALATEFQGGVSRFDPQRGALATEFQNGVARFDPQRAGLATDMQTGRGMYEDPQAGLVGTMAGGRNADETSTMGQVNRFGYDPGKYEGQREDVFRRFASGGGGYDDPTKQALKQTAAIPIQSQLGGIEQAVNRGVARTGNAAGAAGALVSGRLDAANQVSRNLNQAQIQMAEAQRADQSTGLQGLGQLQGEGDARTTYALNAQQNQNAADRARQAQAANMYGQMSQAGDARKQAAANIYGNLANEGTAMKQTAAGIYGNLANESTAMKGQAANMYGQMAQESDQRWNSAFNQYNQLGQNKLTAQQLGLAAQQGMLGQQRGYQQQAFQNLGQLQSEQDASAQQAIQNRMTMEQQARQREQAALQGYQQQQGMADNRYQTQLGTQMAMNEQARGRQQQAMAAQEREIDRNNVNTLAGANMQIGLGNQQNQNQMSLAQLLQGVIGGQQGGAQGAASLITALSSLPIFSGGKGEQAGGQTSVGFSI